MISQLRQPESRVAGTRQVAYINNVLIVEDDHHLANWLAEVLTYENCMVDIASNGMEALDKLCATVYDAVVCDLMMPRIDGESLYKQVCKSYPYLNDKFVFITGLATIQGGMTDFIARGSCFLVPKPISTETLCAALGEVLQR